MKKKVLIPLLIIVLIASVVGGLCYAFRDTIHNTLKGWFQEEESSLSFVAQLQAMQAEMEANNFEIQRLQDEINQKQELINAKQEQTNDEISEEIKTIETQIIALRNRIMELETENKNLEAKIALLQSQIDYLLEKDKSSNELQLFNLYNYGGSPVPVGAHNLYGNILDYNFIVIMVQFANGGYNEGTIYYTVPAKTLSTYATSEQTRLVIKNGEFSIQFYCVSSTQIYVHSRSASISIFYIWGAK